MYKEFFGLREAPFSLTPDPRFLYMSQRHREALAALIYGVRDGKGFILLTGEIGSGKTTLCRAFLKELDSETSNVALVLNSFLTDEELLRTVNQELGIPADEKQGKGELIDALNRFLLDENAKGKTTILIVDEAQNLAPAVLEQIRMLSNLETEKTKLIQIVLIGQPELLDLLAKPELEQLNQRITVRCHVTPLGKREIYQYIRHRLNVAGAKLNVSLTPAALNRVYHYSRGVPRKVNLLCDRALLAAYVAGVVQIDAKIVALAEREIRNLGGGREGRRRLAPSPEAFLRFSLAISVILIGLASCVWAIGIALRRLGQEPPGIALAGPFQTPPVLAIPGFDAATTRTVSALPREAISALGGVPALPAVRAEAEGAWRYDADGIVRVEDPDFARIASLLTLTKIWELPFEMQFFNSESKSKIQGINMMNVLGRKEIALRSFGAGRDLRAATSLDLPLVLDIESPSTATARLADSAAATTLSSCVVLTRIAGGECRVADPLRGLVSMRFPALEKRVARIDVLYRDPDNLASLAPGEEGERVERLRVFLTEAGLWGQAPATRSFNNDMSEAIKRYQKRHGQEPTGRIDGATAALISLDRLSYRPRLAEKEEAANPKAEDSTRKAVNSEPSTLNSEKRAAGSTQKTEEKKAESGKRRTETERRRTAKRRP